MVSSKVDLGNGLDMNGNMNIAISMIIAEKMKLP